MVELRLDSVEDLGMPQDCFVSVRVGEMQKLSKLQSSRVYRFPKAGERRYGKIEVFRRIGSCSVDVDAANPKLRELSIDCAAAGFGTLGLKVSVAGDAKGEADPAEVKKEGTKVRAAREYLSRHGLEVRLADAMQAVLREQPSDPTEFLASRLLQSRDKAGGIKLPPLDAGKQEASAPPVPMKPSVAKPMEEEAQKAAPKGPRELAPLEAAAPAPAPVAAKAKAEAVLPFADYYRAHFGPAGGSALSKCYSRFPVGKPAAAAPRTVAPAPAPAAAKAKAVLPFGDFYRAHFARASDAAFSKCYSKFPVKKQASAAPPAAAPAPAAPAAAAAAAAAAPAPAAPAPAAAEGKTPSHLKPSVGTWLCKIPHRPSAAGAVASAAPGQDAAVAKTAAAAFKLRPSVGTWLAPRPPVVEEARVEKEAEPLTAAASAGFRRMPSVGTWMRPLPRAARVGAGAAAPCPAPAEEDSAADQVRAGAFKTRPSVGTWLAPAPRGPRQASGAAAAPAARADAAVDPEAAPAGSWSRMPSVGTWLAAKPALALCQPAAAACLPAPPQKPGFARRPSVGTRPAAPSFAPRAGEQKLSFATRPSVGTWLAPRRG